MKIISVLSSNKSPNFCDVRRRTNISAVQLYRQKIHHLSSSDPESSRGASVVYAPLCTCEQPHGNRGPATVPSTESQPAVHMLSHRQTELRGLRGTKHVQPHTVNVCVLMSVPLTSQPVQTSCRCATIVNLTKRVKHITGQKNMSKINVWNRKKKPWNQSVFWEWFSHSCLYPVPHKIVNVKLWIW